MKCSNCKRKVDKDKLIIVWIKYFCSEYCKQNYMDWLAYRGRSIKIIWDRKQKRLASEWSEFDLFKKRFNQLLDRWENYCMVTWQLLTEDMVSPASFAHMFSKWQEPIMRYLLNNIALVKWIEEHQKFDLIFNEYKKIRWHIAVKQDILNGKEIYKDILYVTKWLWVG